MKFGLIFWLQFNNTKLTIPKYSVYANVRFLHKLCKWIKDQWKYVL